MSVDNSYVVIHNATNFAATELEVLKNMVIYPDEDEASQYASFESGEEFFAEGELTDVSFDTIRAFCLTCQRLTYSQVPTIEDVWTGNFSFTFPSGNKVVTGQYLTVDPSSGSEQARQLGEAIKAVKEQAATTATE